MNFAQVTTLCQDFWALDPVRRQELISIWLEDTGMEVNNKRKQWTFLGQPVCIPVWTHLLGTSERAVAKALRKEPDLRTSRANLNRIPRGNVQTQVVDRFFIQMYGSAAEPLPDPERRRTKSGNASKGPKSDAHVTFDNEPWLVEGDKINPDESDDEDTMQPMDWNPDAPTVDMVSAGSLASAGVNVGLPMRYLPHGNCKQLFWMFLSTLDVEEELRRLGSTVQGGADEGRPGRSKSSPTPPSYSTFNRRWAKVWSKYLRFRKSSQHSQCNRCFELTRQMYDTSLSMIERLHAAKAIRQHYDDSYLDRCIYWALRYESRVLGDILCIIIDSMDRTKFAWPRWPFSKTPKFLEGIARPRLVVTAALAHGYCTSIFVAEEKVSHGSDAFCEVLAQVLDQVQDICTEQGRPVPSHLVVMSDNTVAQAKNSYAVNFLAYLVGRGKFRSANLFFLMVGHTHEDVDQLFGLITSLLFKMSHGFETAAELCRELYQWLLSRVQGKNEKLIVKEIHGVRDFAAWLAPLGAEAYNCFANRQGILAPHAFSFVRRRDARSRVPGGNPLDVMCNVKNYMRDKRPTQCVLMLPAASINRVQAAVPPSCLPRRPYSAKELDNIGKLQIACARLGMKAAADKLVSLLGARTHVLPALRWLGSPALPHSPAEEKPRNPYFAHLPQNCWQMFVRFR